MSLQLALATTSFGFVLIWASIDNQQLFEGICGGILFGGGVMFGLFAK